MGRYRKIPVCVYTNPAFRHLTDDAKLALLLLTINPKTTPFGALEERAVSLAEEWNWALERVTRVLAELQKAKFLMLDGRSGVIGLPKLVEWDPAANGNVIRGWAGGLEGLRWGSSLCALVSHLRSYIRQNMSASSDAFDSVFRDRVREIIPETASGTVSGTVCPTVRQPLPPTTNHLPPNERVGQEEHHAAAAADPLDGMEALKKAYPGIREALLQAHPMVKLPKPGSAAGLCERKALAALVTLDGHPQEEVLGCLRWLFAAKDEDACFWLRQVHALAPLRKVKDGASKFTRIFEAWRAAQERHPKGDGGDRNGDARRGQAAMAKLLEGFLDKENADGA